MVKSASINILTWNWRAKMKHFSKSYGAIKNAGLHNPGGLTGGVVMRACQGWHSISFKAF